MDTFLFAANAVFPIVLLAMVGYFAKKIGQIGHVFGTQANKLVFRVLLPTLLFINIYNTESIADIDWALIAYTSGMIFVLFLIGLFLIAPTVQQRNQKGVLVQCVFRSNFAIIGLPLAVSLVGDPGARVAAMISLFSIPLFNVLAVFALRIFQHGEKERLNLGEMLRDILTNPLIIGVFAGIAALLLREGFVHAGIAFRLTDVTFFFNFLTRLSGIASPLALIVLGCQFEFSAIRRLIKPILIGTTMRLLAAPILALAGAFLLFPSFGGAEYAGIVCLFGTPVAVSSAVMAGEMGGDTDLAGQLVVWTTVLSAVTLFLLIFMLRLIGIF